MAFRAFKGMPKYRHTMSTTPDKEWPETVGEILGLYEGWVREIESEKQEIEELSKRIKKLNPPVTVKDEWNVPSIPDHRAVPENCSKEQAKSFIISMIDCLKRCETRRFELQNAIPPSKPNPAQTIPSGSDKGD